ncbi:MAG: CBS domain-containing protein [Porticoccaceae bacterium]
MLNSVELKDYMLRNPAKVKQDDDLFVAIDRIVTNKISGVCVVDDDNNLVGVLSELDCMKAILSARYNQETSVGPVKDVMTTDVYCVSPNSDIIDVAQEMLKRGFRRCPVVENGKLVGQITCRQLLNGVQKFAGKS